jgi:hypothetical protein
MRLAGGVVFAALGVGACGVGPDDDFSAALIRQAIPTPVEYFPWWHEISECSGESGDGDALQFYVVISPLALGGKAFPCGDELCNGIWEAPHDITLAPGHVATETLVKHEMLHDLLRVSGHPPVFEECGVTWGTGSADVSPG